MRFLKRLARILALFLLLAAIGAAVLHHLSTRKPGNYNPLALTDEQRAAAANRVETQKIPDLLSLASEAEAKAHATHLAQSAGRPASAAATRPTVPLKISFSQDEINAFLWKWSDPYKTTYERYLKGPFISLEEGEIVLMGTAPEFGRVASAYFKPTIDDQGQLRCDLDRLRVGNLPFPEAMLAKHKAKIESALKLHLPAWQSNAKMEPGGATNTDASAAAAALFILQSLNHQPAPAALFLPKGDWSKSTKTIPVRITTLTVEKGSLSLTLQPMTTEERTTLLQTLRQPLPAPNPSAQLPTNVQ